MRCVAVSPEGGLYYGAVNCQIFPPGPGDNPLELVLPDSTLSGNPSDNSPQPHAFCLPKYWLVLLCIHPCGETGKWQQMLCWPLPLADLFVSLEVLAGLAAMTHVQKLETCNKDFAGRAPPSDFPGE